MTNNEKVINATVVAIAFAFLVPVIWNLLANVSNAAINSITNLSEFRNYKRKLKKGLQNGDIIEIGGYYYEFDVEAYKKMMQEKSGTNIEEA